MNLLKQMVAELSGPLADLEIGVAVLEAALERAESNEKVKAENGTESMFLQEIAYLTQLMHAASRLINPALEELESLNRWGQERVLESKEGGAK